MQKQYPPFSLQMHGTTKGGGRTFLCKLKQIHVENIIAIKLLSLIFHFQGMGKTTQI